MTPSTGKMAPTGVTVAKAFTEGAPLRRAKDAGSRAGRHRRCHCPAIPQKPLQRGTDAPTAQQPHSCVGRHPLQTGNVQKLTFSAARVTLPHAEAVVGRRCRLKHPPSTLPPLLASARRMHHHRGCCPLPWVRRIWQPGAPDPVPPAGAAASTMVATVPSSPLPWSKRKGGSGGGKKEPPATARRLHRHSPVPP